MSRSMALRPWIRRIAVCCCSVSHSSAGSNRGTSTDFPLPSVATKIIKHWQVISSSPVLGSPELTVHTMCMELRPVWTMCACTSTSSPTRTGRLKRTLPT